MNIIRPNNPAVKDILTAKGFAASIILDMSPVDLQAEIAQAAVEGSEAAKKLINSTGVDDEVRSLEASNGSEQAASHVLPDVVEDPFRDAVGVGFDRLEEEVGSIYDYPSEIPDLVMHAAIGF
jgi:adenosine/AMP kinase